MTISALPTAPSTSSPSTFPALADAFVAALATFRTQANALALGMQLAANGGAFAIPFTFSTTTTDSDPGAGYMRLNQATQNTATVIRLDDADNAGRAMAALIALMDDSTSTIKGFIRLQDADDATKFIIFSLASLSVQSGYTNLTVTVVHSSAASPFANAANITLDFLRNGDKGDTGTTGATGATGAAASKDYVRNSAMRFAQWGTSQTGLGAAAAYTLDGWKLGIGGTPAARWTASQETGGGVNGNDNWLKLLCTTADTSVAATEQQFIYQPIEGRYAQGLLNTANDKFGGGVEAYDVIIHKDGASSISFPCQAAFFLTSIDGTARTYVGQVTITAVDTWERVYLAIPSDATATFDNDNGEGLRIGINLYGGTDFNATNNTWNTSAVLTKTSATINLADATNNYIGITRVKLESGATPTGYQYPSNAEDLWNYRYLYCPGATITNSNKKIGNAMHGATSTTNQIIAVPLPVPMRVEPASLSLTCTATDWNCDDGSALYNASNITVNGGAHEAVATLAVTSSGMTQYRPHSLRASGNASAVLKLSAEL